jgi:hypothetical protein
MHLLHACLKYFVTMFQKLYVDRPSHPPIANSLDFECDAIEQKYISRQKCVTNHEYQCII